jgi:malonyl CoA-acyl carrier protein transacylase
VNPNFDDMRAAVVFPGQAPRQDGMRAILEERRPQLLETLSTVFGEDDPFSQAHVSLAAEQALTVSCSLASWHAQGCPTPRYMIGHSLGELTALAAARALSEDDAVRLAAVRGELIEHACDAAGGCGMLAVRAPLFDVELIAEECDVTVALHDGPRQVVVAGTSDALERARTAFAEVDVRCTDLALGAALNSPLVEPAVAGFRAALEECEVHPPQAIVYSAATCRPLIDMRAELAHNLVAPVRWWETLARLAMEGVETFLEISVGGLLSALPAGIVTERAAEAPGVARAVRSAEADPAEAEVFAYFDDDNRLHVLV